MLSTFLFLGTFHTHGFEVQEGAGVKEGFTGPLGPLVSLKNSSRANNVDVTWLHLPSTPAGQPSYAVITLPQLLKTICNNYTEQSFSLMEEPGF